MTLNSFNSEIQGILAENLEPLKGKEKTSFLLKEINDHRDNLGFDPQFSKLVQNFFDPYLLTFHHFLLIFFRILVAFLTSAHRPSLRLILQFDI